ncbi:MAG TPA: hypothetical protein VGE34_00570 [Candidatus Saccharimonadales bacterium]
MKLLKNVRIFFYALLLTGVVVGVKYILHAIGFEPIEQTSLHNAMISSVIFVIGFVLSATIADYKESERIPAEFASNVEGMYEDAKEIRKAYKFDLTFFRKNLIDILGAFREGTRVNRKGARREIADLNVTFGEMEKAGVPANYIVKLKQQQSLLLKSMYRVNYIQKIKFIPSAFLLVRSIVVLALGVLLFTNIDPFYGGLALTGTICFIMTYMLILIQTISVPFHAEGKTRDDVSLFLLRETKTYLQKETEK